MEYHLNLPLKEDELKKLKIGDIVYITGKIFTARDQAHKKMLEMYRKGEKIPFNPSEMALFHCGPLIKKEKNRYIAVSAGPTTSARLSLLETEFIKAFGTKIIIGKGGMGEKFVEASKELGAVYLSYTGGAGALAARSIIEVEDVYWLEELGMPEAVWIFRVEEFGPTVVGIAKGETMYK